jgi:hypothetical protein
MIEEVATADGLGVFVGGVGIFVAGVEVSMLDIYSVIATEL